MKAKKIARSFATHDGTFHADEVTACALLLLFDLIDHDKICRTREKRLLDRCDYVCDVGGKYAPREKLFDHHQAAYTGPLSGAGMILLYLKEQKILSKPEYHFFNDSFIIGVDAQDNGKDVAIPGVSTYSDVIANFLPIYEDAPPKEQDEAFFVALDFALKHLKRLKMRHYYVQSCKKIVEESMKENGAFLLFNEAIPWMEPFFELGGINHPAKFVIIPSGGQWNLRAIPPTYEDRMNVRKPLPSDWAGLIDDDLKKETGIPGAVFCHKERFISVWETKEDAFKALEYTLEENV